MQAGTTFVAAIWAKQARQERKIAAYWHAQAKTWAAVPEQKSAALSLARTWETAARNHEQKLRDLATECELTQPYHFPNSILFPTMDMPIARAISHANYQP